MTGPLDPYNLPDGPSEHDPYPSTEDPSMREKDEAHGGRYHGTVPRDDM